MWHKNLNRKKGRHCTSWIQQPLQTKVKKLLDRRTSFSKTFSNRPLQQRTTVIKKVQDDIFLMRCTAECLKLNNQATINYRLKRIGTVSGTSVQDTSSVGWTCSQLASPLQFCQPFAINLPENVKAKVFLKVFLKSPRRTKNKNLWPCLKKLTLALIYT